MMKNRTILSPMAWGNGAFILHKMIEKRIPNYLVKGYNPYLTVIPFILPLVAPVKGADLIHTAPDYGLFFYSRKIPMIVTVHHYMCDGEMDSYSTVIQSTHYRTDLKWFIKKSIALATSLTAISHYSANHIKKELNLYQKIRVIYNGVDEAFFVPSQKKRETAPVHVLFSGNLIRRKGVHWLPSIADNLKKRIEIHYTSGLKKRFLGFKNKNITHLGQLPYKAMPEVYQQHDILIAPTIREGFGLAIAEAMSCGLPVVASNCSAIPELIDEGKGGFLCPVGDVKAFAEKINLLADSPKLRREMGAYNRAKVEKMFTLDRMIKEYQDLFQEMLG
jgi:glycosyltransferase involved in cell wall biosynthesis